MTSSPQKPSISLPTVPTASPLPRPPPVIKPLRTSASLPVVNQLSVQELRKREPTEALTSIDDAAILSNRNVGSLERERPAGRFMHPDHGSLPARTRAQHAEGPGGSAAHRSEGRSEKRERLPTTRLGLGSSHPFGADKHSPPQERRTHKTADATSPPDVPANASRKGDKVLDKSLPHADIGKRAAGTRPPEWTSTVLRGAGSSLPGNGQQDHHQGRKAREQQGGRRERPGGIDADDLWDDLCQTVRDL